MPYPRHLLNEGEQISLDLRPHWWFFSRHILTGIPLFIALIAATQIESDTLSKVALWPLGIIAIVWAGWLFVKFLEWTRTHFIVTTDRVIFRTGVIARHGVEIPHERINNINFNQKIFERMIGAGDLEIESAGKDGVSTFENVRHPDGVQQEISNDFVWIFAGGTPPNAFLKKIGVGFGARDVTLEASKEAKQADAERKQLAHAAAPN